MSEKPNQTSSEVSPSPANKKSNRFILYVASGVVIVIIIGGGLYYFFKVKPDAAQASTSQSSSANGPRAGGRGSFTPISRINGKLLSISDSTAVVDGSDGQKIVVVSDTTNILKLVISQKSEILKVDNTVSIQGKLGSDGNITAETVTIISTQDVSQFQNTNRPSNGQNASRPNNPRPGNNPNGNNFGGIRFGKITAIDGNKITLQALGTDQPDQTFNVQDSTVYNQQTKGTKTDLKAGQTVTINATNNNNTLVSTNITISN